VTWQIPAEYAEPETLMILALTDPSGQKVFHDFEIRVR
jgi:hypothetical protein